MARTGTNPKWDWMYNRSKEFLESWINDALEEIVSVEDEKIEGMYVAIRAAHPFDLVAINDEVIAAEELLREKGVKVKTHICLPSWICNVYGI